ncbi:MAG: hypothetical protein HQL17_02965 [Candidatus Omnitrophica bacterium]|nr:hypothetical protein [Candidatus Omnitrophota bacterium]
MNKSVFKALGQQFFKWHRTHHLKFEYAGHSKDLELEVKRLTGLIDYVEKKKAKLLRKS